MEKFIDIAYLVAAIFFIYGLKMLSHPKTARNGNRIASFGMLIAIVSTAILGVNLSFEMIVVAMILGSIIGAFFAIKVEMTQMPQLVAMFNGFGGAASALVASSEFLKKYSGFENESSILLIISIVLSLLIGTLTFTGSFIAFGKLQGIVTTKPVTFPGQQILNAVLAIIMVYAGRFIFSLPFLLMILPLIKTKAGLTLFQLLRIWSLLRVLKNSGRFNFNNINQNLNTQSISLDEAYKILNLDPKKKYKKDEVLNSYKKIMKKIHPDVSPELSRLASIVNEAKDKVIKDIG